jgi:hypothetical protein
MSSKPKVCVGQKMYIVADRLYSNGRTNFEAIVEKVGREWITAGNLRFRVADWTVASETPGYVLYESELVYQAKVSRDKLIKELRDRFSKYWVQDPSHLSLEVLQQVEAMTKPLEGS